MSMGANVAPMLLASEPRLRLAILAAAGLRPVGWLPESDPVNFLPRVTIPTLVLQGRYDSIYSGETGQEPVLRLLGTPPEDKRRVLLDTGHALDAAEVRVHFIREVLDWLDRYFGPP
jgi:eukaryotic-like serine/threonine-protein kinase